jgi:peptidoglycan/LPS O-acetylase OafA/YrhL
MTTIMQDSYKYTADGRTAYLINRFLRIFPSYWIAIIFSVVVIFFVGQEYAKNFHGALAIPKDLTEILQNLFILFPDFIPYKVEPRLSPATWAITVELFFYLLIGLGISKNIMFTRVWVLVSVLFVCYSYAANQPANYRYASFFAASLPFSIGSLIYFEKENIHRYMDRNSIFSLYYLVVALIGNIALFTLLYYLSGQKIEVRELGRYLNLIIGSLLIVKLLYYKPPKNLKKIDNSFGDYSYPVYLTHWSAGLLAAYTMSELSITNMTVQFAMAVTVCVGVSHLMIIGCDKNINRLRNMVKSRKLKTASPLPDQQQ